MAYAKELSDRLNKRKIAYVYLLHRMFEGNPTQMLKIMQISGLSVGDIQDWDSDYRDAVYKTIQEEDSRGVTLRDPVKDVPSIKSIKEKVLRRCDDLITETTDPAKLAVVYKTLSEFEVSDDKKEKSVLDAINESIRPLSPKKKEKMTMLEKLQKQKAAATEARVDEDEEEADDDENDTDE